MGIMGLPFPDKKYGVIYADPPWRCRARAFTRGQYIEDYYQTMETQAIANLAVDKIAEPDSWLFLWCVDSMLPEALSVCAAWGFTYKRSFVWDKCCPGLGTYNRSQHEQLLMGKRGQPATPTGESLSVSLIKTKRGGHSEKPWIFRDIITKMFPTQAKIEMFARTPKLLGNPAGWDTWGDEA